jgi:hypothetical protein
VRPDEPVLSPDIEIESQSLSIPSLLRSLLLVGLLLATPVFSLSAQEAREADEDPSPSELARRIEALAEEIEDMQLGEVAGELESKYGFGPAASKIYGVDRGLSFGGYGEMLYENYASEREDGTSANQKSQIDFLRLVLYAGYKFDDHVLFNSEIEFEHSSTGKKGEVSVEFANLDFLVDPRFNARAGLLLVPMGFVNEMHEPPTFYGARRPEVEQRIIPTTWRAAGAGIFGSPQGRLEGLSYRAYVLESLRSVGEDVRFTADGLRSGRQSGSKAVAEDFAGVLRGDYERHGLGVGGSLFFGNTSQGAEVDLGAGPETFGAFTTVYEGHVQFRRRGVSVRALFAGASVGDAEKINAAHGLDPDSVATRHQSVGSTLWGWYVEAGWDVLTALTPGSRFALVPYLRYSELDTQHEVPEGYASDPAKDRSILTLGLAFYPHSQVVFKGDYELQRNEAETGVDQWNLALGFLY